MTLFWVEPWNRSMSVGILALLVTAGASAAPNVLVPPLRLKTLAEIPLGGHTTRLDYASVDARRHLLFVAHLGDSEVIVIVRQLVAAFSTRR
jgi:hypothetical protein